ncbi:MAG: prepilin peptidase [Lachnospiraceae bacterium]|nr:prepilin peptidase [Lachnospiraceae bacterium]
MDLSGIELAFYIFWYVMVFIFGTIIFSFLNVVIYRTPIKISPAKGRSFCPKCHHTLGPLDLVPLFSWLFLRGKCRYCKAPISGRYPLVESIGGFSALASAYFFVDPLYIDFMSAGQAVCAFALCAILTVIAFIDHDTMTIFDWSNVVVAIIGVASFFFFKDITWLERLIGIFVVSLPMYLLVLWKEGAFGGGDIKLFAALGVFFGWKYNLLIFFISTVVGGIYAAIGLAKKTKKRNEHFAFGPFICIAAVLILFFGKAILSWYLGYLGFE